MKFWVIAAIVGVVLLLVSTKDGHVPDTVKCGSETMGPGDVCEETRNGHTESTRTYEDIKASQEASARTFQSWGRWAYLGGGIVLFVGGVTGIVMTRRRRRRLAAQPQAPLPPNVSFVQRPHQPPQYQSVRYAPRQMPPHAPQQNPPRQYAPPQQMPQPTCPRSGRRTRRRASGPPGRRADPAGVPEFR
jgi:hypothetical protein